MRRLLQIELTVLLMAVALLPVLEFFDRWDPPGPDSDTEMAVFGVVVVLALVLLVCRVISQMEGPSGGMASVRVPWVGNGVGVGSVVEESAARARGGPPLLALRI